MVTDSCQSFSRAQDTEQLTHVRNQSGLWVRGHRRSCGPAGPRRVQRTVQVGRVELPANDVYANIQQK